MKKTVRLITRLTLVIVLSIGCLSGQAGADVPQKVPFLKQWKPLLDAELSQFETWIGVPHSSVKGLPEGTYQSDDVHSGTPLGMHPKGKQIFSTITEDGDIVLKITGEIFGGINTKLAYENYHFQTRFKWGDKKWAPRNEIKRDTGILYHCRGEQGAFWSTWKAGLEFQVQETDMGDFIPLGGTAADVRGSRDGGRGKFDPTSDQWMKKVGYTNAASEPDAPHGQWNVLDLYVFGNTGVHVVNGDVVMVSQNARRNGQPLVSGQIQIQSEGAECYYKSMRIRSIKNIPAAIAKAGGLPVSDDTAKAVSTTEASSPTNQAGQAKQSGQINQSSPTTASSDQALQMPRKKDGDGSVTIQGELMQWHKVSLKLNGPFAHEMDNSPNPFTDLCMSVVFTHSDNERFEVPGYFAADGNAGESSADSGTIWIANFAPNKTGKWDYEVSFLAGKNIAIEQHDAATPVEPFDGLSGSFVVNASDKQGRDFRSEGRLSYVGKRYLQFEGSKRYFLKVGADAPETLLAFEDFDNTHAGKPKRAPLKSWTPHLGDWQSGDPVWQSSKGKGLIGAINYLSGKGCNAFSFLTYNAGGDGDNVWPFIQRDDKLHYDCSKLDQWSIVFDHGTSKGMYLHFKMQETENDDHRDKKKDFVPESLDGGQLGPQRRLYCRELIARFGHNLALNWNLGEENTQTTEQVIAMANYISQIDPYDHPIVIHTYPNEQDKVYQPLLGDRSALTGISLQNSSLDATHRQTVKWVRESTEAGKPWVVAFDESGSAAHAQSPDLGYRGFDGRDNQGKKTHTQHDVRKKTLWGTLMGGGGGNEYYFGYRYVENDILAEDWRSRDQSWDYCRIAINFFADNDIPFWSMVNADGLVGNPKHDNSVYCLAKPNSIYLVYLPNGGEQEIDLGGGSGEFSVAWFNPRQGGELITGSLESVQAGSVVSLGTPPTDTTEDWLVVLRRAAN